MKLEDSQVQVQSKQALGLSLCLSDAPLWAITMFYWGGDAARSGLIGILPLCLFLSSKAQIVHRPLSSHLAAQLGCNGARVMLDNQWQFTSSQRAHGAAGETLLSQRERKKRVRLMASDSPADGVGIISASSRGCRHWYDRNIHSGGVSLMY